MMQGNSKQPIKKRKRKAPLVPWKKPKDMPRRPLSAYNLFFQEERERIMTERAKASATLPKEKKRKSNKTVGIGFANLARTIAWSWKNLDPLSRAPYLASASEEKERYQKEMLVWRAKQKAKEGEKKITGIASRSSSADDSKVAATSGLYVEDSRKEKFHHDFSDDSLTPIPLSTAPSEEETMLLASSNVARRNSEMTGMNAMRPPVLSSAFRWPQEYGSQSISDSALLQRARMGMAGHVHPRQGTIHQNTMHPLSSYTHPFEGLYHQQFQQPVVARRYTWSGANPDSFARYESSRRNSIEQPLMHQSSSSMYPDSWLEVERQTSFSHRQRPTEQHTKEKASTNIYPESWFEAHDSNDEDNIQNDEPTQDSKGGEITGKLPPHKTSSRMNEGSHEGKSSEGNSSDVKQARPTHPIRSFHPVEDPVLDSLHVLGLQVDDETTKLEK